MPDAGHLNYWIVALLFLTGLYGMLACPNLMRKLMAMNILQVAVIYFFIVLGLKIPGTPAVLDPAETDVAAYANPLPHVLMLTAIVVGAATTGVSLALLVRIRRRFKTLEEPGVLKGMEE